MSAWKLLWNCLKMFGEDYIAFRPYAVLIVLSASILAGILFAHLIVRRP